MSADLGRMLADASGEDERVETAERGRKRAQFPSDAIDEQINRLLGRRPYR